MAPANPRIPPEEWLKRKALIHDLVLDHKKTQKDIRDILASSGQPADTSIHEFGIVVTPLQIAAQICSKELVAMLLAHSADTNLVLSPQGWQIFELPFHISKLSVDWSWAPLFLAAYSARRPIDLEVVQLLISHEAIVSSYRRISDGFIYNENLLTIIAGKEHENIAVELVELATK
ncbi:hypothetical protein GGR58DRAFT_501229 [Xylaria digitata]|nr:hypothetical protein GGR58DRAFT_501229 [Xylaria digitata]